jgi:hypothetical protein
MAAIPPGPAILSEFFPLGADLPWHETIRRRTAKVGAGIEREVLLRAKSPRSAPAAETITVSIDAGHVRTARGHQGRTFEVMAAQVTNDDRKPVLFGGVPVEADQQHTQLNGVLTGLGMTADTEVTILSDGADGPRSLGEAARMVRGSPMRWNTSAGSLAWPDRAGASPDPAHTRDRQAKGGAKNRGSEIGGEADEGADRTGDIRIWPR